MQVCLSRNLQTRTAIAGKSFFINISEFLAENINIVISTTPNQGSRHAIKLFMYNCDVLLACMCVYWQVRSDIITISANITLRLGYYWSSSLSSE